MLSALSGGDPRAVGSTTAKTLAGCVILAAAAAAVGVEALVTALATGSSAATLPLELRRR